MSCRDELFRWGDSEPIRHQKVWVPGLATGAPGTTAFRGRRGSTARLDVARRGTRGGPARPDGGEASWENEGGRLLRAIRLDENGTKHGALSAESGDRPQRGLQTATRGTAVDGVGMTTRSGVRVGRIYEQRTPQDGVRVLVDRVWPRGLAKKAADLDEWCRDVAPSTALRTWYGHDPLRFDEFARRYRAELDEPEPAAALTHLRELADEQTLILLTATRQPEISQASVLAHLLDPEGGAG